jgi:hypothetical protein
VDAAAQVVEDGADVEGDRASGDGRAGAVVVAGG